MADVLGKYSFLDTPDVNGSLVLLNTGNTPSILSDTAANRPAAGVAGRLFVDTTNNLLYRDTGTEWVIVGSPPGAYILDKSAVTRTFILAAGGDLINTTIPAGVLGTSRMLRIRIGGYFLNNSGGNRSIAPVVSYGGVTMWQDPSTTVPSGATRAAGVNFDLILAANNSATAQTLNGTVTVGGTGTVTSGITGDLGTDEITGSAVISGTSAVNSAVDQSLVVSVSFNGDLNGAGGGFFSNFYYIEVL